MSSWSANKSLTALKVFRSSNCRQNLICSRASSCHFLHLSQTIYKFLINTTTTTIKIKVAGTILRSTLGCKQQAQRSTVRVWSGHKNTENARKNVQYFRWDLCESRFKRLSSAREGKTLFSWVSSFKAIGSATANTSQLTHKDNYIVTILRRENLFDWTPAIRRKKCFSMVDWGRSRNFSFWSENEGKRKHKRLEIFHAKIWKVKKSICEKWRRL